MLEQVDVRGASLPEEDLLLELKRYNKELLEVTSQIGDLTRRQRRLEIQIRDLGKQLQARRAEKVKHAYATRDGSVPQVKGYQKGYT